MILFRHITMVNEANWWILKIKARDKHYSDKPTSWGEKKRKRCSKDIWGKYGLK